MLLGASSTISGALGIDGLAIFLQAQIVELRALEQRSSHRPSGCRWRRARRPAFSAASRVRCDLPPAMPGTPGAAPGAAGCACAFPDGRAGPGAPARPSSAGVATKYCQANSTSAARMMARTDCSCRCSWMLALNADGDWEKRNGIEARRTAQPGDRMAAREPLRRQRQARARRHVLRSPPMHRPSSWA